MQGQGNQVMTSNYGYNDVSSLQIRLQTDNQISKIRMFLCGYETITLEDTETGKLIFKQRKTGDRLMNDQGVNHLTNYISSVINPQVVQGNYDIDWYREQLFNTHKRLAFMLTVNRPKWEIEPTARYSLIGFLMEFIKPYLSRLIENKERESYSQTLKTMESSTINTGSNGVLNKIGIA